MRYGFFLALCSLCFFPLCAEELLINADFSSKRVNGSASNWNMLNGTTETAASGVMTVENQKGKVTLTQVFRPRPEKRVLFSVEVKCSVPDKVRAYVECEYERDGKKAGFNTGSAWKEAKAGEWMTLSGELPALPANYQKCYLAVWNDSGKPMEIRAPHAETADPVWLPNADFSRKEGDKVLRWNYRGKNPDSVRFCGDAVTLAEGLLIQTRLPLRNGRNYQLSFAMRGTTGATARVYIAWNERKADGKTGWGGSFSSSWQKVAQDWQDQTVNFVLPSAAEPAYIVLEVKDALPAEFRGFSLREIPPAADLGGTWELRQHTYPPEGLLLVGMKPGARLHGIPVTPGKRYEVTYEAQVLEKQNLSDDGGFFQLRSNIAPEGIVGSNAMADILHGQGSAVQKRSHVFSIPAGSGITKVIFTISGYNPGRVRLNRFQIREVPVKLSESWSLKLLRPFYRDAFYPGDDVSLIRGEAETKGADRIRLTFQGKTTEIAVKGEVTRFELPFALPEGEYPLQCDLIKEGKVEKSFTRIIARYPAAPNLVSVTPDGKIRFNGKPYFPVFRVYRGEYTEAALYSLSRSGVNTTRIHISHEANLLRQLDMAQKYGIKLFIYPAPPFKAAGLEWFGKRVRECLTQKVITHPALLGYFMPDEPMIAGVRAEVIQKTYQILKAHDPYHPCWLNTAPRNEVADLKPFAEGCDILSVDVYPVPYPNNHSGIADKTPSCCGKYARRAAEIGSGKKAVFVWQQGFAWHECSGPDAAPKPYPTRAESRFMIYDSLLNGGVGCWFWGVDYIRSREFFTQIRALTSEMHRYSGLFARGTQKPDFKTSHPSVRCAVMEWEGKNYYFLLNLTATPQTAEVAVSGKVLDSEGGTLTGGKVSLAPYEVMTVSEAALPPPDYALCAKEEKFESAADPAMLDIDRKNRILSAPRYEGKAKWIWYPNGQLGLARCFAEKKFTVKEGEKVTLLVSADDSFIVYLNGKELGKGNSWAEMTFLDLSRQVIPGENRLTILGIDGGAAPCGILAELHAGTQTIPSDASWKVRAAYQNDPLPDDLDADENAAIVAPYGSGAWGRNVKIIKQNDER